ncbi:RNA-binding domain-containing protein [Gigaspora margarita]|uniref:RNA-binding domain-containing protein n=1 Tax=Gigaspora margarita TaxID=4874 RepID=A0A8H4A7Y9_GIGMA|nr:RNA-binding domain-containing protein [Gigaspora margarita]
MIFVKKKKINFCILVDQISYLNVNFSQMSRLIIKSLPANLTDQKFRAHFSTKGQVTDAKIIRTADGKSRCFGFIGYRTEKEANDALNYFNNTFIFTSRITVEHAKPVCDPALPRPWSAHSVVENDSNESNDLTKNKNDKLFNDELSNESSVSDMEWIRSKMRRRLDIDDDDIDDNDIDVYKNKASKNEFNKYDEDNKVSTNTSSENDDSENELDQMKSMTSHNETDVNKSGKHTEVPPEESIGETGRLFVRNLPYICSEEDLRQIFNKFGPLAEVHIPLDKETKNQKGFAYVLYHIPEHAVKAYIELDNKFFMGRLLHILPSKDKLQIRDLDPSRWSLKKKREMKQKSLASNDFNWSMLYMNSDAIAESIAHRFNVKKSIILDPESDNMAAKLALAETHIIQETKSFLEMNGISLNSFGKKEKSDTVILVKNIPFGVTKDELLQLFGWYGEIGRLIIPPAQTIALIEFLQPSEARNAFTNLAYKKFKGVPLYLEKAPLDVFKSEVDPNSNQTDDDAKKVLSSSDIIENTINEEEEEESSEVIATLFVKNINFNTTTEELNKVFKSTSGMKSAKIKMKNDPKNSGKKLSMGFGFVEYDNMKNAKNALKAMQGYMLDGHSLQLKFSNRGLDMVQRKRKEDEITKKKKDSTKIIVKNVAFETTKKELKELFSAYGQIKTLRLPKKFDGTSRGFAFIEFLTKRDARNVMEQLQNTHLLGRHLVLEYADDEKNIEELREKIGKEFIADIEGGDGRMRKRKKIDMDDWVESKDYMEE